MKAGISARMANVDQTREGLCYRERDFAISEALNEST